jgi:uncharacterized protein YeaO (DUF488 family)
VKRANVKKVMIKRKSVYSPKHASDGLRVFATRFHGPGIKKSRYDIWLPSLGPSEELLKVIERGKITWAEFSRRYQAELFECGPVDRRCSRVKKSRPEIYVTPSQSARAETARDNHVSLP